MTDTLVLLILAHLLADFVFQTNWMVAHKRQPAVLALHGAIVFGFTLAALGGQPWLALGITGAHLVIDAIKLHLAPDTLLTYLLDQAAHLGTLIIAAQFATQGVWQEIPPDLITIALLASGGIVATLAGAPAVGKLMAPYRITASPDGLENAGQIIGLLERAVIFGMVLIGEPTGIGFLIAAKSILRFDTASRNQKVSEYVIIGTLASFGWALAAAYATVHAIGFLDY